VFHITRSSPHFWENVKELPLKYTINLSSEYFKGYFKMVQSRAGHMTFKK
jgi:hypothetical protein